MEPPNYDPRYLDGVRRFNAGDFFGAHEVWEDLWRDDQGYSHKYFQGLIQVAVCLHHFRRGNTRGARKLYHSSSAYLQPYGPRHLGLDLNDLLARLQDCCRDVIESADPYPRCDFDPARAPIIQLDPPPKDSEENAWNSPT